MHELEDRRQERTLYKPIDDTLRYWFKDDIWLHKISDLGMGAKPFDITGALRGIPFALEVKVVARFGNKASTLVAPDNMFTGYQKANLRAVSRAGGRGLGLLHIFVRENSMFEWRKEWGIGHQLKINALVPLSAFEVFAETTWEHWVEKMMSNRVDLDYYPWDKLVKVWDMSLFHDYLRSEKRWF